MDAEMVRLMEEDTPRLNPTLANGLATEQMLLAERYIDEVMKSTARGFPESLQYMGCQRCNPFEEFSEVIRNQSGRRKNKRNVKRAFETAQSNFYLMKYFFRFNGEELPPRYVYLPFVSDAGSITISGSRFNITPVLADRVISIGENHIFVRPQRDKLTFYRQPHAYVADDVRENVQIVHSLIYHIKPVPSIKTCIVHYLLCKYGFTETFTRFANCPSAVVRESFDPVEYPPEQWVICASTNIKPRARNKLALSIDNVKVKVAIRREEYTNDVKNFVAGFFYVVDHFPSQMTAEYVDSTRQWMILMGYILFTGNLGVGELYRRVDDHIGSLDEYVDTITQERFADIDIHVKDIYEFFSIIIVKYNAWWLSGVSKINSMYDKELNVLYFTLSDITEGIMNFHFRIQSIVKKNKELTRKDVEAALAKFLTMRKIYDLNKKHNEVSAFSYSGDNKAFLITSSLLPQSATTKGRKGKGGDMASLNDPSKKLHFSVAEVGSYCGMPKSDPSGQERLNHCAEIDSRGVVIRNPKFDKLRELVQSMI